jgi:hypothetical protein
MLEVEVWVEMGELDRCDRMLAAVGIVGEGARLLVVDDEVVVVAGVLADVEEFGLEHAIVLEPSEDGVVDVDGVVPVREADDRIDVGGAQRKC